MYGLQARRQVTVHRDSCLFTDNRDNCVAPKDGSGITGLRLFCSLTRDARGKHKLTEKILEFPGSSGDWGKKLTCNEHQWATSIHVRYATGTPDENLGVVQMRLICRRFGIGDETSQGIVFPYGENSGSPGFLETEDPLNWQQGLTEGPLKDWQWVEVCDNFIKGANVQTDQNNEQLSAVPEEVADMVGINNVELACDIYGEFCLF